MNGTCSDPGTGKGKHSNKRDCERECGPAPAPAAGKWSCTKRGCKRDDQKGIYDSSTACEDACKWDCIGTECVQHGAGSHESYHDCMSACPASPPPHPSPPTPRPHDLPQQKRVHMSQIGYCDRSYATASNNWYYKPGSEPRAPVGASCNPGVIGAKARRLGGSRVPRPTVIFRKPPKPGRR